MVRAGVLGYCINIMRSRWRGKKWGKPEMTPDGCEGCQNPAPWDLSTTSTSSSAPLTNLCFLFIGPIKPIVALVLYCERKKLGYIHISNWKLCQFFGAEVHPRGPLTHESNFCLLPGKRINDHTLQDVRRVKKSFFCKNYLQSHNQQLWRRSTSLDSRT